MLYQVFSPERAHTRPSRFAGKRAIKARRLPERRVRGEVMSFSMDVFPGWSDERGSAAPVELADRRERVSSYQSMPTQMPVGNFDTVRIPAVSREGLKASTALMLLAVMLFVTGVTWLVYRSQIIEVGKRINADNVRMAQLNREAESLEMEIADITTDVSIAEKARDMGMISSRGVAVVYLDAPDNAVFTPANDGTFGSGYLASILGD